MSCSVDSHSNKSAPEQEAVPPGAPSFSCLCENGLLAATEGERWMAEKTMDVFPPVPFPPARMYREVGEVKIRALVTRQHERLVESEIGHMFANPRTLAASVNKTIAFVIEASGGPVLFTPAFGEARMRSRHFRVTISERDRNVWLQELLAAFDDVDFPLAWRESYWRWMESFSIRMINRRTSMDLPPRFVYNEAMPKLLQALGLVATQWRPDSQL